MKGKRQKEGRTDIGNKGMQTELESVKKRDNC